MEKNFIMTNDTETANSLKRLGFPSLNNTNGMYVFINCPALSFADSSIDIAKITYSNVYTAS